MTGEAEAPRDCRILEALLIPLDKDVARSQDSGRGDDRFDHVGAVETGLVVSCTIGKGEREETLLSDAIVIR